MHLKRGLIAFSAFAACLTSSYSSCFAQSKASANGDDSLERVWYRQRSAVKGAVDADKAVTSVKPAGLNLSGKAGKEDRSKQGSTVAPTALLRGDTSALKVVAAEAKDSWEKISAQTKVAASTLGDEIKEAIDYDKKKLNIGTATSQSPATKQDSK